MDHSSFSNSENFTPPQPPSEQRPSGSLSRASMILGIVSLVVLVCCFPLSFVAGIIGIVLAVMARQSGKALDPQAKAGLVCSIIALSITVLIALFVVVVLLLMVQSGSLM